MEIDVLLDLQPYCPFSHTVLATVFYSPPYNIGPIYDPIQMGQKKLSEAQKFKHKTKNVHTKMVSCSERKQS